MRVNFLIWYFDPGIKNIVGVKLSSHTGTGGRYDNYGEANDDKVGNMTTR